MACKPHGAAQAATRTNVRRHNSQNAYSYLLDASAVVPLYAEDAARRLDKTSLAPAHSADSRRRVGRQIASVCII
jgi:hypothetical protein